MDFEEFKEQFAEDVKNDLEGKGIDASVKDNTVEKMNENYDALTVTPEGSNVGVNLNMNKFFEAYDSGDVDYDQVVDDIPSSVMVELAKALHTTPNYLLLGDIEEDDWMDDMIQILQKISRPEYRELAKKQIELIANIGNN